MAEQRTGDDTVLKFRGGRGTLSFRGGVKELDNSGVVTDHTASKLVDDKDLKFHQGAAFFDPFDEWDTIFYKALDDKGPDTNRHEYFMVVPFNVQGDDDLTGINDCDGGGGKTQQKGHGVVAGTKLKQKKDCSTSGGDRRRQITDWDFANGGGEVVVEHERDCGGSDGLKWICSEGRGSGWWKKWCYCWHCGM